MTLKPCTRDVDFANCRRDRWLLPKIRLRQKIGGKYLRLVCGIWTLLLIGSTIAAQTQHAGKSKERRTVLYRIEVTDALLQHKDTFNEVVRDSLMDPRGWQQVAEVTFKPSAGKTYNVRFILATPYQVDRYCYPLRTNRFFSCRNGRTIAINANRFLKGSRHWNSSLERYRIHVINHEMGHYLGFGHRRCRRRGQLAPIMMQQTKGLFGCITNEWPDPMAGFTSLRQ